MFWARGLPEYGENLFFSEEGGCLCRIVETNGWDAKGGSVDVGYGKVEAGLATGGACEGNETVELVEGFGGSG